MVGRLQNLIVVIVEAGHHGAGHAARDAAIVEVQVLPGLELRAVAHGRERRVALAHAVRLRGVSAVGRIDDERRLVAPQAAVEPEAVVGPGLSGRRRAVAVRLGLRVEFGALLRREQRLPLEVVGPLERRRRPVRPDSLQVGVAPRRARRLLRCEGRDAKRRDDRRDRRRPQQTPVQTPHLTPPASGIPLRTDPPNRERLILRGHRPVCQRWPATHRLSPSALHNGNASAAGRSTPTTPTRST